MPRLIDEQYMRDTFNIHKDVLSTRITPYLASASRRLKKWVGADVYLTNDADLQSELKLAEGLIVMHLMLLNLNTHIRAKGLVATETVEGNVTTRYFNPTETSQSAREYLDQAAEIVGDFSLLTDIPPAPEFTEYEITSEIPIWLT